MSARILSKRQSNCDAVSITLGYGYGDGSGQGDGDGTGDSTGYWFGGAYGLGAGAGGQEWATLAGGVFGFDHDGGWVDPNEPEDFETKPLT